MQDKHCFTTPVPNTGLAGLGVNGAGVGVEVGPSDHKIDPTVLEPGLMYDVGQDRDNVRRSF